VNAHEYVGRTIREVREACGKAQIELAAELGHKDSATLSRWETGKQMPSIPSFCAVCVLCGVEPSSTIGGIATWKALLEYR
jgi:transcriptional regulator with XRE-family HTH domain